MYRILYFLFVFYLSIGLSAYAQVSNNNIEEGCLSISPEDSLPYWKDIKNDTLTLKLRKKYNEVINSNNDIKELLSIAKQIMPVLHKNGEFFKELFVGSNIILKLNDGEFLEDRAIILLYMGEASRAVGNFNSGLEYLDEAGRIFKQLKDYNKLSHVYDRKAAILYQYSDDINKTIEYCNKAINLARKYSNFEVECSCIEIKGAIARDLKQYEKASSYFNKIIDIYKKNNKPAPANTYINICNNYYKQKKYEEALKAGLFAYEQIKNTNNNPQITNITEILSHIYEDTGDYKNAYRFLKLAEETSNDKYKIDRNAKVDELFKKYQLRKKQQLLDDAIWQKRILIYGLIFLLIFASIFIIQVLKIKKINKKLLQKNEIIKQQADELKLKNQKLENLNEFKTSINSTIVHDIKNPLSIIIELSKNKNNNILSNIYAYSNQILQLVISILEISKYEKTDLTLSLKNENIDKIIKQEVDNIKLFARKKNIKIINNSKYNFYIDLDAFHIRRVLNNLIYNAIKHSYNNGEIIITVEKINDYELKISVSDTGDGINNNFINNLFEQYFQGDYKKTNDSYGIGLAYCKIATQAHNGKIGAYNNKDKGATFWFTIKSTNKIKSDKASEKTLVGTDIVPDLTVQEKEIIKKYIYDLSKIEIDEISTFKKTLNKIPEQSENIANWKQEVYTSVISANKEKLRVLLNLN